MEINRSQIRASRGFVDEFLDVTSLLRFSFGFGFSDTKFAKFKMTTENIYLFIPNVIGEMKFFCYI